MKYDANDYLKRKFELFGLDKKLIELYSIVLKNLKLKPTEIELNNNNILWILADVDSLDKTGKKSYRFKVLDNKTLTIYISYENKYSQIIYHICYDGNHYELSIFKNLDSNYEFDKLAGIYYVNKNKNGFAEYSFYDYKAYNELYDGFRRNIDLFNYNPNFFYKNGFNPDWYSTSETNSQLSDEELAIELNSIVLNCGLDYSANIFNKLANNYETKEPEMNLILK